MKHTPPPSWTHYLIASFIIAVACNQPPVTTHEQPKDQYVLVPNAVGFDIQQLEGDGSTHQWLATYTSQGKTAKFTIELGASKPLPDTGSLDFDVEAGAGRFISESGSDASVLLAELKKALQAKKAPVRVKRISDLPFKFVSLGKNQSQASRGGFNSKPPGNWTPMKIFIGKGEQEGQVFLNLNPVLKKGQFSMKDSDYGDIVLAQFARVL